MKQNKLLINDPSSYLLRQTNKNILLDTNLLILLQVGLMNIELINKHKKLSRFTKEDYSFIINYLVEKKHNLFIPREVIVETDNQVRYGVTDLAQFTNFGEFIPIKFIEPELIKYKEIVKNVNYINFGITDTVIIENAKNSEDLIIITSDVKLHNRLLSYELSSINFNQLIPNFRSM